MSELQKKEEPIVDTEGSVCAASSNDIVDDDRHGQYQRSFTPRQVHIISLGSNIGSGLFIATGKALANGGPGSFILGYGIVCATVWTILQTLSEMTIAFPVSGNFVDFADRWVDPALAFGAGLAEWIAWTSATGAEATFFHVLVQMWSKDKLPEAVSLTIFMVTCFTVFCLPNKWFGWFEYVTSMIKIFTFLIIIVVSLAIILGAGPNGKIHHGETWTQLPVFKNGFVGFGNAALLGLWAVGDQTFIGIMGGEAKNPRYSLAHATKLVPFRVNFIYMSAVILITILVPSDDNRLLGATGIAASPFIIAIIDAEIPYLPDILNACMICGLMAIAAESIYIASRILRTMSHQGLIPDYFAKVDSKGRPRMALAVTILAATFLTYINLSSGGRVGFAWLSSIASASFFAIWFVISLTNFRFRQAIKAQGVPIFSADYAWSSRWWPFCPAFSMLVAIFLFASCLASSIRPLDGSGFSAYNFFQNIIGLIVIVGCSAIYKVVLRTPWRDPKTADLQTGYRHLSPEDLIQLDGYYTMSAWRRFVTYVKLW